MDDAASALSMPSLASSCNKTALFDHLQLLSNFSTPCFIYQYCLLPIFIQQLDPNGDTTDDRNLIALKLPPLDEAEMKRCDEPT